MTLTVQESTGTFAFPKICGVLVEPRKLEATCKLVENFHTVMPARMLFFFCGISFYGYYRLLFADDPFVTVISCGTDNFTAESHNDFWKTRRFWETFTGYTHVLTIQTDGCLCTRSTRKIEDFLQYDYVGGYTPHKWWWKETQGLHKFTDYQCFNGGFSFRRIQCMLDVIDAFPPLPSQGFREDLSFRSYGEDLYFVVGMLMINSVRSTNVYKVGLDEFSTHFCTHTHYVHDTFCVHKLDNYVDGSELTRFLEYCPEFNDFTDSNRK